MSLCQISRRKEPANQKTLSGKRFGNTGLYNGTPLCIRDGSYTVEAAVVIPLVTVFLVTILFFFRVLQVQTDIQKSLTYAGRKCAVDSCFLPDAAVLVTAKGYFVSDVKDSDAVSRYVTKGAVGISLASSRVKGDYIELCAVCRVKFPVNIFSLGDIKLVVGSKNRRWTGRDENANDSASVVYCTPTGKAYHKSKACPYLDLSIRGVKFEEISGLRNKNGHKYYECSKCAAKITNGNLVYITNYGTAYHASLGCQELKRTVYELPISMVGGRHACPKCWK